jgi:NAD(P)H dehydrogenase (quinone)
MLIHSATTYFAQKINIFAFFIICMPSLWAYHCTIAFLISYHGHPAKWRAATRFVMRKYELGGVKLKKNIAIIIGHPYPQSYCNALAQAYKKGAANSGADVRILDLGRISFDPNLKYGYHQRTELEPDLLAAQETLRWADHLVWVYPNWWGTMPALLKGFIDRVLLPGFAFKSEPNSFRIQKLLKGKTARLIVTMDSPPWYYRLVLRGAGHHIMKRGILQFCGVHPVRITEIGTVKITSAEVREKWLRKVEELGGKGA